LAIENTETNPSRALNKTLLQEIRENLANTNISEGACAAEGSRKDGSPGEAAGTLQALKEEKNRLEVHKTILTIINLLVSGKAAHAEWAG